MKKYGNSKIIRAPIFCRGKSSSSLFLNYLSFAFSASICGLLRLRNEDFDIIFVFQPSPITVGLPLSVLKSGAWLFGKYSLAEKLCSNLQVDISNTKILLNWTPPLTMKQGLNQLNVEK